MEKQAGETMDLGDVCHSAAIHMRAKVHDAVLQGCGLVGTWHGSNPTTPGHAAEDCWAPYGPSLTPNVAAATRMCVEHRRCRTCRSGWTGLTCTYSTLPSKVPVKSPGVVLCFMGDAALKGRVTTCPFRASFCCCKARRWGSMKRSPSWRDLNWSNVASLFCE